MFETVRRLWGGAKKFIQHEFSTRVEMSGGSPRILVSREAYEDMFVLVDECKQEVGWLGSVDRIGSDFLVKEVFLFDQEVHGATCELTPDGLAAFATEILSSRRDGMEVANSLRFWGHSHVNMGTSPSGQDESQLRELANSCGDFFVRAILNKNGRMEFTIIMVSIGVVIHDAAWELYEPQADEVRRQKWQAEIASKVKEKTFALPIGYSPVDGGHYWGGEDEVVSAPIRGFSHNGYKKKGGRHGD